MKGHSRAAAMVLAATSLTAALAVALGRKASQRQIAREEAHLLAQGANDATEPISHADLATLPEPVRRWLDWAGVVGTRRPAVVHLRQRGRLRLGADKPWMPFHAEEHYTTSPPGFIWPATFTLASFITIDGRDAYINGRGSIDMRLFGLIPVARQQGPEMDQGALLRFLNEIVWFPAAALAPYITWDEIDTTSARATITNSGVTASAIFVFDQTGRPVDMCATRYRTTDRGYELSTWSTPFRAYGEFAGICVPVAGEGIWKLETGDFGYVDLRVEAITYEVPRS